MAFWRVIQMISLRSGKKNYKGKKYGIIRRNTPHCGLFSFFIVILGGINKCIEEGLIPIIDMQTYKNPYLESEQVGKSNAWEFWFMQPMGIGLDQVKMSETVIIDADKDIPENCRPVISMDFLTNPYALCYWRNICKKYIKIKPDVAEVLVERKKTILDSADGKILGVLCRGTDYLLLKPQGHPVQPDDEEVIVKAKEIMEERKCQNIFLATEDNDIFQRFRQVFGDRLLENPQQRYSGVSGHLLADIMETDKTNKMENGLNYLTSVYLLSKCDCLIAGRVSGLLGTLLLGGEYEYSYFWNYGVYGQNYTTYEE